MARDPKSGGYMAAPSHGRYHSECTFWCLRIIAKDMRICRAGVDSKQPFHLFFFGENKKTLQTVLNYFVSNAKFGKHYILLFFFLSICNISKKDYLRFSRGCAILHTDRYLAV